jgi:hypothetical protein
MWVFFGIGRSNLRRRRTALSSNFVPPDEEKTVPSMVKDQGKHTFIAETNVCCLSNDDKRLAEVPVPLATNAPKEHGQ